MNKVLACLLIFGLIMAVTLPVAAETIMVSGGTSLSPVFEALEAEFESSTGIELIIRGGGAGAGFREAVDGSTDFGKVTRALTTDEASQVQQVLIGLDALVVIVNADNPVDNLSRSQLRDIYRGRTNSWVELGWEDRPILLLSKELGRATLDLFEEYTDLVSHERGIAGNTITHIPLN